MTHGITHPSYRNGIPYPTLFEWKVLPGPVDELLSKFGGRVPI